MLASLSFPHSVHRHGRVFPNCDPGGGAPECPLCPVVKRLKEKSPIALCIQGFFVSTGFTCNSVSDRYYRQRMSMFTGNRKRTARNGVMLNSFPVKSHSN